MLSALPPHRTRVALGVLALLTIIAHANSLPNDFAFDDALIIRDNPLVHRLGHLPTLFVTDYWAGSPLHQEEEGVRRPGLYRPLVMATYAVDWAVGRGRPLSFHLTNLALATAVALALHGLARRVGLSPGAALFGAAVFAVHPLHTEAVTGIVGRAELLMSLGVLLALHWHLEAGRGGPGRGRRSVLALAAFAGALLSKEQAMVLPALVVLADLAGRPPGGGWRDLLAGWPRHAGYVAVLGAYLGVRWLALGEFLGHGRRVPFADNPLAHTPWADRVPTALAVAGRYLSLFVWPDRLSADYSYDAIPLMPSLLAPAVLGAVAAWSALGALGLWGYARGRPVVGFGVALTIIAFLPASNLIVPIGTIMGERLFYLPSAGLCLLVGAAGERSWAGLAPRLGSRPGRAAALAGLAAVGVLLPLGIRTVVRNRDWRTTTRLMERAVEVVPRSAKVHRNLAMAAGSPREAIARFETALGIYPRYLDMDRDLNMAYGSALVNVGRVEEAVPLLERAIRLKVRHREAHYTLGFAYMRLRRWAEAETALRNTLALSFDHPAAHNGLSLVLRAQERYPEALAHAEEALRLRPDLAEAHYNRGRAAEALGRRAEAEAAFRQAVALKPDLTVAREALDRVLKGGRP